MVNKQTTDIQNIIVDSNDIEQAHKRIAHIVQRTPIMQSNLLNRWLGHDIFFKAECLQTTGAFKLRGASNFIAKMAEEKNLPAKIVANSSGNHAQAVAFAAQHFDIPVTIYSSANISAVKAAATKYYGAELELFASRAQADLAVQQASKQGDTVWIPPFNHADIIAGQGTVALEALQQVPDIDAIFAPCGGGGLVSGTCIWGHSINPHMQIVGVEPLSANDAACSLRKGTIVTLNHPPNTLADGAATPSVGQLTFPILQQLNAFYEVTETDIAYWTQWLSHLLKLHIEPTSAMTMQGVVAWLREQAINGNCNKQRIMVIISGGNVSTETMHKTWQHDHLQQPPQLSLK